MAQDLVVHESAWEPSAHQRCTATSKSTGKRCRNFTGQPGLWVCHYHGGAKQVVRQAAEAPFRSLLTKALLALESALESGDTATKLRAARYVMKYSGLTPRNIRSEARAERTLKAIGRGPTPTPSDEEIESLIELLTLGDSDEPRGLEAGESEAAT